MVDWTAEPRVSLRDHSSAVKMADNWVEKMAVSMVDQTVQNSVDLTVVSTVVPMEAPMAESMAAHSAVSKVGASGN